MPMFKVYLGNLDLKVTAEMLTLLFEPFGDTTEIVIATDAEGKSRGFAIILFKDPLKGQLAIETLANRKILGRTVVINEAIKKGKKTQPAERMPRNTPLGPRAFPRVGGGGMGRGGAGGPRSASAGGRFIRNPRRLFNQPGMGAPGASASGAPGSGAIGASGATGASSSSVPGAPSSGATPPGSAATPSVPPAVSAPKPPQSVVRPAAVPRPAATPIRKPIAPAAPAKPAVAPEPAAAPRPRATKKTPPPAGS